MPRNSRSTEGQAPAEPASEPGAAAEAEELPAVEKPPAGATGEPVPA